MKQMISTPTSTAIISALICVPFVLLFSLLMLNIEPDFGPLDPLLNNPNPDQPNVIGSLIALGSALLVLVAFSVNILLIGRTIRAGGNIMAHPANLVLAIVAFAAISIVIGAIIIDQYPCWVGVPNCD